jgi:hypothetical protein
LLGLQYLENRLECQRRLQAAAAQKYHHEHLCRIVSLASERAKQRRYHLGYEVETPKGKNDAPTNGSVWVGGDCSLRIVRGGSWDGSPGNVRSAFRVGGVANTRDGNLGFRVGRTLITP